MEDLKAPLDIIAENLPTFMDCYEFPKRISLPSYGRLAKEAQRIMAALAAEGFEIVKRDPGQGALK